MKAKLTLIVEIDDDQIEKIIEDEDDAYLTDEGEFYPPGNWTADDIDEMMTNGMMSVLSLEQAEKIEDEVEEEDKG